MMRNNPVRILLCTTPGFGINVSHAPCTVVVAVHGAAEPWFALSKR